MSKKWNPSVYIPVKYRGQIEARAKEQGLTTSKYIQSLIERDMDIDFGTQEYSPHGESPRRKDVT